MYHLFSIKRHLPWLALGLLAVQFGAAPMARAGKTPGGGASGVTTTGSTLLPIGGSPITNETTASNSPNVSIDPQTGNLTLTPGAQQAVNRTAAQLIQRLQTENPGLVAALSDPFEVNPDQEFATLTLAVRNIQDGQPIAKASLPEAAVDARFAIAEQLRWAILQADQNELELTAPLVVLGSPDQFSMEAIFNPDSDVATARIPLQGTLEQLGNATVFLILTAGNGISPEAIAPFLAMALEGAPVEDLIDLMNAVNALVVATAASEDIDPNQLNRALHAHRAIVEAADQNTLNDLAANTEFTALGQALRQLRQAVDT